MSKLMNYINNWLGGECFLLKDEFNGNAGAPLATPRTCTHMGQLILDQTDGQFSIVNNEFVWPAQGTPAWGDQDWYALDNAGVAYARVLGRVLKYRTVRTDAAGAHVWWGWNPDNTPDSWANSEHIFYSNAAPGTRMRCLTGGGDNIALRDVFPAQNNYMQLAIVLSPYDSNGLHWYPGSGGTFEYGAHFFWRDESGDDSWRLVWYRQLENTDPLYPAFSNYNSAGRMDYVRIPCDDTAIWNPLFTPIAWDEFTDANGTTLPNHTITYSNITGLAWVSAVGSWIITGNEADPDNTSMGIVYVPIVSPDVWEEANIDLTNTAAAQTGLLGRRSENTAGGRNEWRLMVQGATAGNDTRINELNNGVITTRAQSDQDPASAVHNMRVRYDDEQITQYLDYVEANHYATGWFNKHATHFGLLNGGDTDARFDNFIILPRGTGLIRICYDDFTHANGTSLDATTTEEGALAWVEDVGAWIITGNEADPDNSADATAHVPSTVANAWVTARVTLATSGAWAGIIARKSADTGGNKNEWEFRLRGTFVGQDTILVDINNGVSTARAIADNDWLLTSYYMDMYCNGQTITCYVDGTQVLTFATATFNETATWAGLVTGSGHTNARWDQFRVTEIPASGEYDSALDSF